MVEPVYLWGEGYREYELERGAPNLDCMEPEELEGWRDAVLRSPARAARSLFGRAGASQVRVARLLARYAGLKASAGRSRLGGDIRSATHDEALCDAIYESLPDYARSW